MSIRIGGLACLSIVAGSASASDPPESLWADHDDYVIQDVILEKSDVFNLSDPEQDKWLYRVANRLHIITRDDTIMDQLLFEPGGALDKRRLDESERILRTNKYLYDANITVERISPEKVNVHVHTRDVWSLQPELSYSRRGGETRTRFGLAETNLLGRGQKLRFLRDNDVDRSENTLEFVDRNLGRSRVSLLAHYSDNSDGSRSQLNVTRPFYELDARWAAGGNAVNDDRRTPLYQFGEEAAEYQHERYYLYLFAGRSNGLVGGRAKRWTTGIVFDDNRFSEVPEPTLPAFIPSDRKLVYPFIGYQLIEDEFVTAKNRDQIGRTEDFQMGLNLRAMLGLSDKAFGADRDAAIFSASASHGFGSLDARSLFLSTATSGRLESGDLANATISFNARYYSKQSEKRTFFASASGTFGRDLDVDNQVEIGGKSGLRGYPLRYQVGDSKVLATIEQRYYTDWYPFRFARVGGAIFADVGRAWGENPLGADHRGWLADVGFGLRLALTRLSAGDVLHIDLAFPLNNDPNIDDTQLLIELRDGF